MTRLPARPSSALLLFFVATIVSDEVGAISVPTGKLTPITPAKVTPRPTYHPPSASPAPVLEYTYDNPEPAPLDPSWVPIPVKYLNILRANSVLFIPVRIPNPNYYSQAAEEQPQPTQQQGNTIGQKQEPATQTQHSSPAAYQPNTAVYQPQQPNNAVYQPQQPTGAVYQTQQPAAAVYQTQQPTAAVYQTQQPTAAVYQTQQPTAAVYQTQQSNAQNQDNAAANQTQQPTAPVYPSQQQVYQKPVYPKQADSAANQNEIPEFGAKISPKQKWKPNYYLPKSQYKQSTKSGYPKKALAEQSRKYYYYYPVATNAQ